MTGSSAALSATEYELEIKHGLVLSIQVMSQQQYSE